MGTLIKDNTNRVGSIKIKHRIVEIILASFVLLFLYTATNKLLNYEASELKMSKSPIITEFAGFLVWLVPSIEIGIVLLLLWPRTMLLGFYASFMIMIMFTVYIIAILKFSDHIPCSCGGAISSLTWNEHLIFNIAFIVLALLAIYLKSTEKKSPFNIKRKKYSLRN